MQIRYIEEADIPDVLACEYSSHAVHDKDFDVTTMPDYAWTKKDLIQSIRQYGSGEKGTNDTKCYVSEIEIEVVDENGKKDLANWVVGALILEIQQDGYEILLFTSRKDAEDVRPKMVDFVIGKAVKSKRRKRISISIPDGDYRNLKFFQDYGFSYKLIRKKDRDEWLCEYTIKSDAELERV